MNRCRTCPDDPTAPRLPGYFYQAYQFARHLIRTAIGGSDLVSDQVFNQRLDVCNPCEHRLENRCTLCGCYLDVGPDGEPGKSAFRVEACPLGKWEIIDAIPNKDEKPSL